MQLSISGSDIQDLSENNEAEKKNFIRSREILLPKQNISYSYTHNRKMIG